MAYHTIRSISVDGCERSQLRATPSSPPFWAIRVAAFFFGVCGVNRKLPLSRWRPWLVRAGWDSYAS